MAVILHNTSLSPDSTSILDSHVHYTPPELQAWVRENGAREPYWDRLLNAPRSIQGWVSAETMIADMDAAGIDQVVLVGEYWLQHESCVRRNDQVLALMDAHPDRILAMAIVQPNAVDAVKEVERCLDGGMIGVGELNPYAQKFDLNGAPFHAIAELCTARNVPINLHVSEEIGREYLGKSKTPLRAYYDFICAHPDLKVILAHWGGGLLFYELMPHVKRQMRHVWYDSAASPLLYPTKRIIQTALTCVEPHKLLYGSDYPLLIYPKKMDVPDFRPFLSALRKQNVDEGFFGRNFRNMLTLTT